MARNGAGRNQQLFEPERLPVPRVEVSAVEIDLVDHRAQAQVDAVVTVERSIVDKYTFLIAIARQKAFGKRWALIRQGIVGRGYDGKFAVTQTALYHLPRRIACRQFPRPERCTGMSSCSAPLA